MTKGVSRQERSAMPKAEKQGPSSASCCMRQDSTTQTTNVDDYDSGSKVALDSWQIRLHQHFAALAKERVVSGHPVFALEHGLEEGEIESLEADVRASLKVRPPSDAFWLPWVVYATEIGYKYDGEEYWQTFEQITPGWSTCRSKPREWLRDRFLGFHKTYHGIHPSGRWATQ